MDTSPSPYRSWLKSLVVASLVVPTIPGTNNDIATPTTLPSTPQTAVRATTHLGWDLLSFSSDLTWQWQVEPLL